MAEGVYYPDEGGAHVNNDAWETFLINWNNVQLYGGFCGYGPASETLRTQRDWTAHPTILSGDLQQDDTNTDENAIAETWNDMQGSNAYNVLILDGRTNQPLTGDTVIDGFIVTAGDGDPIGAFGSGLYCSEWGGWTCVQPHVVAPHLQRQPGLLRRGDVQRWC